MTKKQLLRATALILILLMTFLILNDMFESKNSGLASKRFYTIRTLEEDTVDALFFGTSGIDRYWIASQGYENYGITSYPLSCDAFPAWLYPYVIDEALSKQDASLIVLDIRPFTQSNYTRKLDTLDVRARRVLDVLPALSVNRTKAAFKTMEILHKVNLEKMKTGADTTEKDHPRIDISYLFSFIRYHQMWEEKDYTLDDHLGNDPHLYGGFFFSESLTLRAKEQQSVYDPDTFQELDAISEQALYDVIEYVKEKDLNVLFLDTPQCRTKKECARANTVYKILEQENMKYLHYYSTERETGFSVDLDLKKDFYNPGHVNFYGATKFTENLALYLKEHYELPDRRQDEKAAADWEGVHDRLLTKLEEVKEKKIKQQEAQKQELEKLQNSNALLNKEITLAENIK